MVDYYVAIDGGGTKTDAVLFDHTGHIHHRVIGESTNPNAPTQEQLTERFKSIFNALFLSHKANISSLKHCFAGMSGADHPVLNDRIRQIIQGTLPVPAERVQVENDAVNALWSGTEGKEGMVVIAGTGSILYGRYANGESFRIGGWGHLVSDEGSGYHIGREAVAYALKAHDGLREKGVLFESLLKHFQIEKMSDVIPLIYDDPKPALAGVVPIVDKATAQGDPVAQQIMETAIQALLELIHAGLDHFNQKRISIVATGGIWKSETIYNNVRDQIEQPLIRPEVPPVYGSMIGALGEAGENNTFTTLKKLLMTK
ncbi:N-acetylglucosamine kinase [Pullulanibacillus pueri]|nr:BadF/BadG/BcrA/BcrD ATPase family protein [Pullulanibacillus pueri]